MVALGISWRSLSLQQAGIQTRLQTEAIHDPGVSWALVRMLQRGR